MFSAAVTGVRLFFRKREASICEMYNGRGVSAPAAPRDLRPLASRLPQIAHERRLGEGTGEAAQTLAFNAATGNAFTWVINGGRYVRLNIKSYTYLDIITLMWVYVGICI